MRLLLVGCGAMGSAMLKGWMNHKLIKHFDIIVLNPEKHDVSDNRITLYKSPSDLPQSYAADLIVFAVKPHQLANILPLYKDIACIKASVAAGKTVAFYQEFFPDEAFVRVMPNTPVAVGQGSLLLYAENLPDEKKAFVSSVFELLGSVHWLDDESEFNTATTLSGCGPAYLFLLIEAMGEAGIKAGLDKRLAYALAEETVLGAATYAASSPLPPSTLRENVTSPGGMTASALDVLMPDYSELMERAVQAAVARGKAMQ